MFKTGTLFSYDEGGHTLGEYTTAGALGAEYIYADGTPVGYVTGGVVYYIETDALGTPRQVILPGATTSTDTQVWKWDSFASSSAFGENSPSVQTITFNLRFPGQYFDSETGLHYNYQRYYEPGTDRYTSSDRIGLLGGINTYVYVGAQPLTRFDPLGLLAPPAPPPVAPPPAPPTGLWPRIAPLCRAVTTNPYVLAIVAAAWPSPTSGCDQPYPPPENNCQKGDTHCEEEISHCRDLCRKARVDPDMRNIWGGSWAKCLAGCVSIACQGHLDPNEYEDK